MYILMNKDNQIGNFSIEPGTLSDKYKIQKLITEKQANTTNT